MIPQSSEQMTRSGGPTSYNRKSATAKRSKRPAQTPSIRNKNNNLNWFYTQGVFWEGVEESVCVGVRRSLSKLSSGPVGAGHPSESNERIKIKTLQLSCLIKI